MKRGKSYSNANSFAFEQEPETSGRIGMKRLLLATALVVLGVAGCQTRDKGSAPPPPPSSATPVVNIKDGAPASVSPNPLTFSKGQGEVTIVWSIGAAGYRFAGKNGIYIDGELVGGSSGKLVKEQNEIVKCSANSDRTQYSCLNRNTRKGDYKYTVNLETADGKPTKPLDPTIANW
jgi:outer membrane lipoprotein SlyB